MQFWQKARAPWPRARRLLVAESLGVLGISPAERGLLKDYGPGERGPGMFPCLAGPGKVACKSTNQVC